MAQTAFSKAIIKILWVLLFLGHPIYLKIFQLLLHRFFRSFLQSQTKSNHSEIKSTGANFLIAGQFYPIRCCCSPGADHFYDSFFFKSILSFKLKMCFFRDQLQKSRVFTPKTFFWRSISNSGSSKLRILFISIETNLKNQNF